MPMVWSPRTSAPTAHGRRCTPPCPQVVSGGGWWTAANLHWDGSVASSSSGSSSDNGGNGSPPLLEFVVTDGQDAWDKVRAV